MGFRARIVWGMGYKWYKVSGQEKEKQKHEDDQSDRCLCLNQKQPPEESRAGLRSTTPIQKATTKCISVCCFNPKMRHRHVCLEEGRSQTLTQFTKHAETKSTPFTETASRSGRRLQDTDGKKQKKTLSEFLYFVADHLFK